MKIQSYNKTQKRIRQSSQLRKSKKIFRIASFTELLRYRSTEVLLQIAVPKTLASLGKEEMNVFCANFTRTSLWVFTRYICYTKKPSLFECIMLSCEYIKVSLGVSDIIILPKQLFSCSYFLCICPDYLKQIKFSNRIIWDRLYLKLMVKYEHNFNIFV